MDVVDKGIPYPYPCAEYVHNKQKCAFDSAENSFSVKDSALNIHDSHFGANEKWGEEISQISTHE